MPRAAKKSAKKAASADFKNFVPYKPKKGEEYMNEKQREHFKAILLILSLIHISEPTRPPSTSRMPSSA